MKGSPATDIMEAIADFKNVETTDLDFSLGDYIEPGAINQLTQQQNSIWMLTFKIPEHEITVTSDGDILVDNQQVENTIEA